MVRSPDQACRGSRERQDARVLLAAERPTDEGDDHADRGLGYAEEVADEASHQERVLVRGVHRHRIALGDRQRDVILESVVVDRGNTVGVLEDTIGVGHRGGRIAVDRVYRYEDLPDAVADICSRLGIELDLPHAKQGSGPHYRELYGPGDAEIVAQRFARTIREFGYEF